ncbi:hypothetical protein ACFQ21_16740 [Ohtaekwangia kribbensis]|jgi:hypothetical protein|uniref:Uncharacterized protein n=1 Tax=Ohtaekwangia kribbensis TaxID=688913 RepID=A0ABW3K6C6_9BACT
MDILLFKTNVDKRDLPVLQMAMNSVAGVKKWTIDLDDCDKVLRITCRHVSEIYIEVLLKSEGFECTPMTYEI